MPHSYGISLRLDFLFGESIKEAAKAMPMAMVPATAATSTAV